MEDALFQTAVSRMRPPARMGVICVDVTNKCDLRCSNCTRLLVNQDHLFDMSLENFRAAVRSLRRYPGIIAVIGGNPCMHRDFESLCRILAEEIPEKHRRGIWTNNAFAFAGLLRETFGVFNLNPHGNVRGIASFESFRDMGWNFTGVSDHSAILAAVQDFYGPQEMWDLIAKCDINQHWSASITENRGKLRAYFCEVAAAFDLARGTDFGLEVTDGWWERPMQDFAGQIRHFCPGCGVPARIKGSLDHEELDTYSDTNRDLAIKSGQKKRRRIVEIAPTQCLTHTGHPVIEYAIDLKKPCDPSS